MRLGNSAACWTNRAAYEHKKRAFSLCACIRWSTSMTIINHFDYRVINEDTYEQSCTNISTHELLMPNLLLAMWPYNWAVVFSLSGRGVFVIAECSNIGIRPPCMPPNTWRFVNVIRRTALMCAISYAAYVFHTNLIRWQYCHTRMGSVNVANSTRAITQRRLLSHVRCYYLSQIFDIGGAIKWVVATMCYTLHVHNKQN